MQPFWPLARYISVEQSILYRGTIGGNIYNINYMKTNKSIIDTYNTIYSVDIVVANKYTTVEKLNKLYSYYNGNKLDDDIKDGVCSVCRCKRLSDNHPIILIVWNSDLPSYKVDNKKAYMINTMAHEAVHAALDTWGYMQEFVSKDNQEPFAYYVGWIAECIYKTIIKK